jgi:HlyD family secretion protein
VLKRTVMVLVGLGVFARVVVSFLPKPVPVELATVTRGSLEVTVTEDGKTQVKDRYIVSSPLAGNVGRIELRAGDLVQQSQVLARLVPLASPLLDARSRSSVNARIAAAYAGKRQAYAQIERARVSLDFATRDVERMRTLVNSGTVTPTALERSELESRTLRVELTSSEFGAKIAEYEVQIAEAAKGRLTSGKNFDEFAISSPIRGRILKVFRDSEGAVQAGMPLLEIGDPNALEVVVDVLTSDAVRISPGASVRLERWGGRPLNGVVRRLEPSAFTRLSALGVEEQRVNVIIELTSKSEDWSALGDGYRVEARIVLWQSSNVLKLPASSTFRHRGVWSVFVVRRNVARLVHVEIGENSGLEVQLIQGLVEGDRVVTHPSDRIKEGVEVTPL